MIIEHVNIHNIGPFFRPFSMELDPRVTIITGSNDVGKSSLLDALELAFSTEPIIEDQVNHDYLQKVGSNWTKDSNISVEAKLALTRSEDIPAYNAPLQPGDFVIVKHCLAVDVSSTKHVFRVKNRQGFQGALSVPKVIRPTLKGGLRNEIDLRQLLPLEQALLDTAFEEEFIFSKYQGLTDLQFTRVLIRAKNHLDKLLERVLPSPGMLRVDLHPIAGERHRIALMLRDRHDGITPFGLRGEGVRRMVTLLTELITTARGENHRLILLDEPESSLHADAQHLLREFLWNMTIDGQTQVVYATHSPCMINPVRPEQIRLLIREQCGETANTKLVRRPASENFAGVRTSLGLSAADSLLYAPVTVVTEGETEVRNILPIIQKLTSSGEAQFSDANKLLGLCTFLDGNGDSFELLCRVARSHGTQVVLFLDGDKRNKVQTQGVETTNPGMPIIFMPGSSEFEELVTQQIYIQAALELVGLQYTSEIMDDFRAWSSGNERRQKRAFTKRVEEWFLDQFDEPFQSKPSIMRKAIELASVSDINAAPIKELLAGIRQVLQNSSFA